MPVSGVLPVIPTPFLDGRFDGESLARLLEHMLPGVDGYTLAGSTGEAPSLTTAERKDIISRAIAMTPGDKTVVVGVSHTSPAESADLSRHAQQLGAAGVLCCAPFYYGNQPDGILAFLAEVDAALEIDLVLYDNPVTTKTTLHAEWPVAWARELEHLTSVKLTDHDLSKIPVWKDAGLSVLAGDDPILFQFLAAGVDGVMVIAPAVLPESFAMVWAQVQAGDTESAHETFSREIAPFIHAFGIGDEIATTKTLLADLGIFASDELLAPLRPVDPSRRAQLRQAYDLGRAAAEARKAAAATAA